MHNARNGNDGSLNLACASTQEDHPDPNDAQQKLPDGHIVQERLL